MHRWLLLEKNVTGIEGKPHYQVGLLLFTSLPLWETAFYMSQGLCSRWNSVLGVVVQCGAFGLHALGGSLPSPPAKKRPSPNSLMGLSWDSINCEGDNVLPRLFRPNHGGLSFPHFKCLDTHKPRTIRKQLLSCHKSDGSVSDSLQCGARIEFSQNLVLDTSCLSVPLSFWFICNGFSLLDAAFQSVIHFKLMNLHFYHFTFLKSLVGNRDILLWFSL